MRKDSYLPQHQDVKEVSNLKVQMVVKSLKSHGYVNEVYNWQWSYYAVTDKGVQFLAKALGKLPIRCLLTRISLFSRLLRRRSSHHEEEGRRPEAKGRGR